jgi:hypothetical protein
MNEELQKMISCDSKGNQLYGGGKYKLHLPPEIPASDFWSIVVYDLQDRLLINTDHQWPSVRSGNKKLIYNSDGSVDAWFGPDCIEGKESN